MGASDSDVRLCPDVLTTVLVLTSSTLGFVGTSTMMAWVLVAEVLAP